MFASPLLKNDMFSEYVLMSDRSFRFHVLSAFIRIDFYYYYYLFR